jgi:hypothetical protein
VGRRALPLLLVVAVAAFVANLAAGSPASAGSSFYVVEPDPRMCPSPLCGGYWVSLANHARTRCADGMLHPRCYAARAADTVGAPVSAIPDQALVRGRLEPDRDDLGLLVVARLFEPAGKAKPTGRYFRLVDTGIRCVREPCFSMRASLLNSSTSTLISGVVLSTLGHQRNLEERVLAELGARNGVLVRGRVVVNPIGGRELHASRFYLRSAS